MQFHVKVGRMRQKSWMTISHVRRLLKPGLSHPGDANQMSFYAVFTGKSALIREKTEIITLRTTAKPVAEKT